MKKLIFTSFVFSFIAVSAQAQQAKDSKKNPATTQAVASKTTDEKKLSQAKVSAPSDNATSTPSAAFSTAVAQTNAASEKAKKAASVAQPVNNKTTLKSKVKKD